ncbi:hypothetical protein [Jidongwangia harbinensis]|uniref:hypothetical protein n=1 Tax=Jidongwangia harbinensis TaxID=2878561 RepID=UPI001CD9451B|nr:hypothetical protein [Jidongwangia harbinensis]MCA2212159.1 hypothetical protein [Jidongwangia harbinensis]
MSRWLPLYLRSRRVPAALAASAGAVAVVATAWSVLAEDGPVGTGLAVLTVALAAAPLAPTLSGTDPALEKTAALPWPPRRIAHLVVCAAIVVGMLAAARIVGADFGPAEVLLRNAAGLIGLTALGTALAGAGNAWQLPLSWAAVGCFVAAPGGPEWRQAALWMVQEPDNRVAAVTAATFALAGLVAYAVRVGPPVSAAEAPMEQ